MKYRREDIPNALEYLYNNYPDAKTNNNKKVGSSGFQDLTESYKFVSMKQSVFKNVNFIDSLFENVALTNSMFDCVKFINTSLIGSSFANCNFFMADIDGHGKILEANNFSHSNFEICTFRSVELFKSGMLDALFHNCEFNDAYFHGSTLEGTKFIKCNFLNCDFGNVNIEYTTFSKSEYKNVQFPFYQIAYIIGAADFIGNNKYEIYASIGKKKIPLSEFREQINNLILYYLDKNEYFAACNLCIAKQDIIEAKIFLMEGIKNAISTRNFRMISNFCQLARYHNLIDDNIKQEIITEMDNFISIKNIPESQLNYYLIYAGKIKTFLNEGTKDTVTLNYSIKTDMNKEDGTEVSYINELVGNLNVRLSQMDGIQGFNVLISNHSPFEIAVGIITLVGSITSIAESVFNIISTAKDNKNEKYKLPNNYEKIDTEAYQKYIGARIDAMKNELISLQQFYSNKKLKKHIIEVTQSLKTDLEEFYSKDIMIFKIKKKDED